MSEMVRAFVNGHGVEVPKGATAIDAVRAWDPVSADLVRDGKRAIADSRGLPAPPEQPVVGGAIYRVVSARSRGAEGA